MMQYSVTVIDLLCISLDACMCFSVFIYKFCKSDVYVASSVVIIKLIIIELYIRYLRLLHIADENGLMESISEYEQGKEEWTQYCERLEYYFAANGVLEEAKKKSIFLTVIGSSSYELFRSSKSNDLLTSSQLATNSF